jgi:DnaJ-class molecular chaperone
LGEENNAQIAKIAWLSRKDSGKAYGSMVVYLTKSSDAKRLLQDQFFHITGESAYTRAFEPRASPITCYRCQELGHRAYTCSKPQICARCAQEGHHHKECQSMSEKCVHCNGPHEAFSRNCRKIYPARNE